MIIDYYSVKGCTYEVYNGSPVLLAPDGVKEETLKQCGFERRLSDGRMIHYLNQDELWHIQYYGGQGQEVIDMTNFIQTKSQPSGDGMVLAYIGLGLIAAQVVIVLYMFFTGDVPSGVLGVLSFFGIASGVVLGVLCAKYPRNKLGKILLILQIVLYVMYGVVMMSYLACSACFNWTFSPHCYF
ncbi:MAG: hypothetical protein MJ062_03435 [Oscillospiraceae bacterium]|nr:hypothetical protein [Oscillospiraceae bacterium]